MHGQPVHQGMCSKSFAGLSCSSACAGMALSHQMRAKEDGKQNRKKQEKESNPCYELVLWYFT